MTEAWLPWLLVLQGVLAGADTLVNHELIARLPQKPSARPELRLHVLRELIWTGLLFGLAWFAWQARTAARSRSARAARAGAARDGRMASAAGAQ